MIRPEFPKMRICVVCPHPGDGTAWWRVVSPLSVLREQTGGHFDFEIFSEVDHVMISKFDILLMQRPIRPNDVGYMHMAKKLGIPVIVEYDDDYTNVPANNPRMMMYMQPEVQQRVRELLSGADLVTTSTPELKKRWLGLNKRIAIIPNAWDDRMQLSRGVNRLPTTNVMWRGGDSHNQDLEQFSDQIVRAAWEGNSAIYHFLGNSAWPIHDKMPPASINEYPFTDILGYFNLLGEVRPNILIVPLAETPFNKCKSNISILEGAWAGAAVLAPDWDDWRCEGVTNYKNPLDFGNKLIELTKKSRAELFALNKLTWDAIRDRMLVSRANKLRTALFGALVDEFRRKRARPTGNEQDQLAEFVGLEVKHAEDSSGPATVIGDSGGTGPDAPEELGSGLRAVPSLPEVDGVRPGADEAR